MTYPTKLLTAAALLALLPVACDQVPDDAALDEHDIGADDEADASLEPGTRALTAPADFVAAGDCCSVDAAPGCSDATVEACVCAADPYCCTTAWDSLCASEVESLGCGACVNPGYCCAAERSSGCSEDAAVEACVCAADPYCCTTAWDSLCASEVESLGCGSCAGGWVLGIGGAGLESVEPSGAVATDAEGNVYVVGAFLSVTLDLGGDSLTREGYIDVFLVSYDASGAYRWSRRLGGTGWEYARGVDVDALGNVYVTGEIEGPLDLGGGALPPSGGTRDLFIASYTSAGEHRWSQRHGGVGTSILASDLAVDDAGNGVVVGQVRTPTANMLALAFDADGGIRWSRAMGGNDEAVGMGVAVDDVGGAVIVGYLAGAVDFGTGVQTSAGSADGVTVRLDAAGDTQWVRRYGSTSIDIADDVALDGDGNVYMTGTFAHTIDLGDGPLVAAGSIEVLIASYDAAGGLRWSRRVGGSGLDYARGIALDGDGHVVTTGSFFGGPADFGGVALAGAGGYDVYLASYAADTGAHRWSSRFGGAAVEEGYDLAVSPTGDVVVVGLFGATMPVAGDTLTSAGEKDLFVASLRP